MSPEAFILGIIIGAILAAPIGPLALICIQRSITRGSLHGFVSGLGVATADAIYAGIVASGLTLIAQVLLVWHLPLRILAGICLVYIGYRVFRSPAEYKGAPPNGEKTLFHEFTSMAILAAANIFTIIAIGLFLSGSGIVIGTESPLAGIVFAGGVFAGELVWWLLVCTALGSVRYHLHPARLVLINKVSGVIIAIAGITMIILLFFL